MTKYQDINSIVIVKNDNGTTATLRFKNPKYDKIISTTKHSSIYKLIEITVAKALDD